MPNRAQRSPRFKSSSAPSVSQPLPSAVHRYDVFLSHRFRDREAVDALHHQIENDLGYTAYVDWKDDPGLDRTRVDRATAERFRQVMRYCRCLLFYARPQVDESTWMPWEIGFFDGRQGARRIAVYADDPKEFSSGPQEYLDLYEVVGMDTLPGFLERATEDTAAMTSATYDQWQRHVDKIATDPLDYGLSLVQWYFGFGANLLLDPARMQAVGDDEPSGPLRDWVLPLQPWYDALRQRQAEVAQLRRHVRRATPHSTQPMTGLPTADVVTAAAPLAKAAVVTR